MFLCVRKHINYNDNYKVIFTDDYDRYNYKLFENEIIKGEYIFVCHCDKKTYLQILELINEYKYDCCGMNFYNKKCIEIIVMNIINNTINNIIIDYNIDYRINFISAVGNNTYIDTFNKHTIRDLLKKNINEICIDEYENMYMMVIYRIKKYYDKFITINIITDDKIELTKNIVIDYYKMNNNIEFINANMIKRFIKKYINIDVDDDFCYDLQYIVNNYELDYDEVKSIISHYNIKTKEDYEKLCEKDERLSIDPSCYNGFVNWVDFLNIDNNYYDEYECFLYVKRYILNKKIKRTIFSDEIIINTIHKINKKVPPYNVFIEIYTKKDLVNIHKYK